MSAVPSAATAPRPASPFAVVERMAWRIPLPTRRLFVVMALALAVSLGAAGIAGGIVASRNAATIDEATTAGLGIASAATEFRTNLAAADAEAAATLISGGLEDPGRRARYDADLLAASRALTSAGLVATDDDAEDVSALADGLVRYAGLVETSRANSRQGFPVGSAYMNQARAAADDVLVPIAERLRRSGEQRVAEAANRVGGPLGALAITLLAIALAVLLVSGAVIAGRTRRVTSPALLGALVVLLVALGVVTAAIVQQSRELRAAATTDLDAYIAANEASFSLSNLRVTEISAVAARGSGAPLYELFATDAATLLDSLDEDEGDAQLVDGVERYVGGVEEVAATDLGGDNRGAAAITLSGASAEGFADADEAASEGVARTLDQLDDRFDAADDAAVAPLVPVVLGLLGAALAAGGTLARARRYR